MNKTFLKSVITGVVGLTLVASCSKAASEKSSHKCASNNCSGKKVEETKKVKPEAKVTKKAKKEKFLEK